MTDRSRFPPPPPPRPPSSDNGYGPQSNAAAAMPATPSSRTKIVPPPPSSTTAATPGRIVARPVIARAQLGTPSRAGMPPLAAQSGSSVPAMPSMSMVRNDDLVSETERLAGLSVNAPRFQMPPASTLQQQTSVPPPMQRPSPSAQGMPPTPTKQTISFSISANGHSHPPNTPNIRVPLPPPPPPPFQSSQQYPRPPPPQLQQHHQQQQHSTPPSTVSQQQASYLPYPPPGHSIPPPSPIQQYHQQQQQQKQPHHHHHQQQQQQQYQVAAPPPQPPAEPHQMPQNQQQYFGQRNPLTHQPSYPQQYSTQSTKQPSHPQQMQQQPPQTHQTTQQPRPPQPMHPPHPAAQTHRAPLQEKDKIDPSQIPRIPLFTRPHHAPATIYPTPTLPPGTGVSSTDSIMTQIASLPPPPPADSRYVTYNNINASPRIIRSTVHTFPMDGSTDRKCGVPLGLVVCPLAGLTKLCGEGMTNVGDDGRGRRINRIASDGNGGPQMGDIYNNDNEESLDYIPLPQGTDETPDPERITVLRSKPSNANPSRTITPPRCNRCHAYLNPFCTSQHQTSSPSWGYAPVQRYDCNFCGTKNSILIPDEYVADGLVDAATRYGTVEYEVGGAYIVRNAAENVRLYGVEYVPRSLLEEGNEGRGHHHGSVKSFGWEEALHAIRGVAEALRETSPPKEGGGRSSVKIGVFAYCQSMLVFPYVKRALEKRHGVVEDADDEPNMEIGVSIVSDVEEDPFCPLPLDAWTYDIGGNDMDWIRFCHVMDSFTEVMEMLTSDCSKKGNAWTRNCGGAALVALADALKDSGGRATLITTRRPNHGVGALRDREAGQQSHYLRTSSEQRLFSPLQRLTFTATALRPDEERDRQASIFYKKLGEDCARWRVSMDIVVTSSLLKWPSLSMGQHSSLGTAVPNVREFLDVATLSELCRVSCGKFKWLRVGNECGIALTETNNGTERGCSFTGEQLREELKRSALAYMGSDAVFKLRCSNGVQVKSYSPALPFGTIIGDGIVDSAELELSSVDSSTAIAVLLEHKIGGVVHTRDGGKKTDAPPMVFFQSAVLYTTMTGRRRVRVSTLGLSTTKIAADVFRSADLGTVATIIARQAVSDLNRSDDGSLKLARDNVFQQCVSILANYRLHTNARTSPSGQLILPESLQLLPLFCLSLRKSRMFRHSLQSNAPSAKPFPTADERAYHIFYSSIVSPNIALQSLHPNVFQISDMRTRDGDWITPQVLQANKLLDEDVIAASLHPVSQLPKTTNPSMTCLDESGMYILDDRFAFYLFIGKDVPEEKWRELIHVETSQDDSGGMYNGVPVGSLSLATTDGGHKLRGILRQLKMMNAPNSTLALNIRPTHPPLILVFVGRGSVFEEEMDSLLIDDPDTHEKSYVDFLCTMHRAIRDKTANAE